MLCAQERVLQLELISICLMRQLDIKAYIEILGISPPPKKRLQNSYKNINV